jgi:hypothetical protein
MKAKRNFAEGVMKISSAFDKHRFASTDLVAFAILCAGAIRVFGNAEISSRLDNTTLLYLTAAAAVFLLRRTKTFKFGDLQVELQELKAEAKEANLRAGIAEDALKVNVPAAVVGIPAKLGMLASEIQPGKYDNDPWKGVFGGKSLDNVRGRVLEAEVDALRASPGWFSVILKVSSLPGAQPLEGDVIFFLHDTFPNPKPVVKSAHGTAVLRIKAWGAFTNGVLADGGETRLELDLADLEKAPMDFRTR